jgi:hypothetical protein
MDLALTPRTSKRSSALDGGICVLEIRIPLRDISNDGSFEVTIGLALLVTEYKSFKHIQYFGGRYGQVIIYAIVLRAILAN